MNGASLINSSGRPLRLLGVNRAGSEYACAQGWGVFDGPTDAASISAMTSWRVNAVRVPLNEDCWLGINGVPAAYGGAIYRDAVAAYVGRLHAAGLIVVLDLHWNAPGGALALGQQVMADADHSPAFWSSVASRFVADRAVVFDLYNEPHDISWSCWRDGCTTAEGWRAAGMQSLLDAVRATGARQPVLAGGNQWGGDLSGWSAYRPADPAHQLAAGLHLYSFSRCSTAACWDAEVAPVAAVVPVVTGETGEDDCAGGWVAAYMSWADAHAVGYLGWTWNPWECRSGPALISAWDGTPTAYGAVVKAHLASLAAGAAPAATKVVTTWTTATTSVQDFDRTVRPWLAESPSTTLSVSRRAHTGAGSLAVQWRTPRTTTGVLRVNDGADHLRASGGRLLTAWVLVPLGSPGKAWRAQLQLQDRGWSWRGGAQVPLVPGRWTAVRFRPGQGDWTGHRALGVQLLSEQPAAALARVYVDDVTQST